MYKKIIEIANFVRQTIIDNKNALWVQKWDWFTCFPSACCDKTSEVLKRYLIDNGILDFDFIFKEWSINHKDYNHVWLENDTYSLDITASMFDWRWEWAIFDEIILIKKGEYFFNNQDGRYERYKPTFFEKPLKGYFDYEEFYLKYFKKY